MNFKLLSDDQVKVCRVCLAMEVKMHNLFIDPLKTHYESIGFHVITSPQLPMYLCFECAELVRKFGLFKERCLRGQTLLFGLLQNAAQLSQEVLNQIDRKQALIKSNYDTSGIKTVEYKPIDNCINDYNIETENTENHIVKEEYIPPEDNVSESYTIEDIPIQKYEDSYQDTVYSSCETGIITVEYHPINDNGKKYHNIEIKNTENYKVKDEYVTPEHNIPESCTIDIPIQKLEHSYQDTVYSSDDEPLTNKVKKNQSLQTENMDESLSISAKSSSATAKCSSTVTKSPSAKVNSTEIVNGHDDNNLVEYEAINLTPQQQYEEIEKRKESNNYKLSVYQCELCYHGFDNTATWNNHMKKHDPSSGDMECEICKLRFPTKFKLKKHLVYHVKKYACKGCSFVATNISQAKLHQRWHKGITYRCDICGKVSMKQNTHFSHIRQKHPSQHICYICGYSFVSERGIQQHKAMMHRDVVETATDVVEQESDLYCDKCDVNFGSLEAYNRHMISSTKHTESKDLNLVCHECGKSFPTANELRSHRSKQHPQERRPVKKKSPFKKNSSRSWPAQCEHCPEEIPNARDYWTHFRRAHPDKPYPVRKDYICDICGKTFKINAFLTYHKRRHTSERLFSCASCGKSFYTRTSLTSHERTHSGDRPYACTLCPKTFLHPGNLARHYRIHDGQKPFECDVCGKAFSQSNSRNVHVLTVHLKQPAPYISKARLEKKKTSKEVKE